ncbi:MAG: preprotein translocase subunit SecE [bacterium]|nr:preprotein translocase subunit SecE [bacterium]
MFERLKLFLQESRRELSRVNWPTREETMRLTGVVVAISLIIAIFLGAFDYIFYRGIQTLVNTKPVVAPIESPLQATTTVSTTTGLPINFVPTDIKSDGKVKVTTEKPSATTLPVNILTQ